MNELGNRLNTLSSRNHRNARWFGGLVQSESWSTNYQFAGKEYRGLQGFREAERRQNRLFRRPATSQRRNYKEVIE